MALASKYLLHHVCLPDPLQYSRIYSTICSWPPPKDKQRMLSVRTLISSFLASAPHFQRIFWLIRYTKKNIQYLCTSAQGLGQVMSVARSTLFVIIFLALLNECIFFTQYSTILLVQFWYLSFYIFRGTLLYGSSVSRGSLSQSCDGVKL